MAIGAPRNDDNGTDSGHVRIFENQGGTWIQIGEDINGEGVDDRSGTSVSLSSDGSIVAIGAPRNDDNGADSGYVRIFENQGGTWTQIGEDINGEAAGDQSGASVSLSGVLAIGASGNDDNGENSGHVRVYSLDGLLSTEDSTLTGFSVFPNPAQSSVTISLAGSDSVDKVVIYNTLGQEVMRSITTTIDISSLSKGVYVVEVTTPLGRGSEKLIIN